MLTKAQGLLWVDCDIIAITAFSSTAVSAQFTETQIACSCTCNDDVFVSVWTSACVRQCVWERGFKASLSFNIW